ncbi:Tat pathway signal sequence domain protein [Lentzea aerocolonigenes]|uniref:Tat pathway signal sequence domain protein n=1 Tax=Lentzea aerocolonigenes TaxID=68170 RepID=A0A0F0GX30_LENAE|nr:DUF3455 domain-containing protein [Lentzea aerocolonigenes]KJK47136.1 Tat pathway signal sequence domain protein [Lentzea aerocolonigenes]
MTNIRRIAAGLAVAAMAAVGLVAATAPAGGAPSTSAMQVPDVIKVPAGNRQIAVLQAHGVQTYQCANGSWGFLQPDAILESYGRAVVLHSRGPVWTSVVDGSSVTAAAVASSPVPLAIPQVLLRATANRGPGLLGEVTFVQRLNTTGGLSPTGACKDGVTASIPYTADYTFWVATPKA